MADEGRTNLGRGLSSLLGDDADAGAEAGGCAHRAGDGLESAMRALGLGVHFFAGGRLQLPSERDLQRAWRRAALLTHPDKCGAAGGQAAATEKFKSVGAAHDDLLAAVQSRRKSGAGSSET